MPSLRMETSLYVPAYIQLTRHILTVTVGSMHSDKQIWHIESGCDKKLDLRRAKLEGLQRRTATPTMV